METKICNRCNKKLPATTKYFPKNSTCRGGIAPTCRKCMNKYNRERRRMGDTANALDKREIQKIKYKKGQIYKVSHKDWRETIEFKGELIQEEKDFITLKNKKGLIESFLKVDFEIGEKKIKEVIR